MSIEVALANAGFDASQWRAYMIPRARGSSTTDPHVKFLIEFFFPDLYDKVERAAEARRGIPRKNHSEDGVAEHDLFSESNWRFTSTLKEITFFWLQDAVILLKEYPRLVQSTPRSTLTKNAEAREAFSELGKQVLAC